LFWTCQNHHDVQSEFTDGYEDKIVVFGNHREADAECSRRAFETDLSVYLGRATSLAHVTIVDGSKSCHFSYSRGDDRHQSWFYKAGLQDEDPAKDGQTRLSRRRGLAGGLGGQPFPTPALDAWVCSRSST
jgi:hypothetical protein